MKPSTAQELADKLHIYNAKPTKLESEAAAQLRTQDTLLRQALEVLTYNGAANRRDGMAVINAIKEHLAS